MTRTLETEYKNPQTDLEKEIAELGPWFHNIHLPDGTQTAPDHFLGDFPSFKWNLISVHLPKNLQGWSVLDIGCNAGFYSFELAKRGASVCGIDYDERYLRQARWAAREMHLENRVHFECSQVYDLAHNRRKYDMVLFMGVFYHLRYPLLALDIVSRMVERVFIFQTMMMPGDELIDTPRDVGIYDRDILRRASWPQMAFIEKCLAGDPTNWWVPNKSGMEAMLRSCGLKILSSPAEEIYLCEPNPDVTNIRLL